MAIELENVLPSEIEKRSFEIINDVSIQVQILIMHRTLYFRKMQLHVQKKQSVMEHPL